MTWTFTHDLAAYLAAAGPALAAEPVANTTLLTVTDALERRGTDAYGSAEPFFGWWTAADGNVSGALLCTPPYPLLIGAMPQEAVRALGAALAAEPLLAGVDALNARRHDAQALAAAWGRRSEVTEENRLYRLAGLLTPDPAPAGRARTAVEDDLPLLLDWAGAFKRRPGSRAAPPRPSCATGSRTGACCSGKTPGHRCRWPGSSAPSARCPGSARCTPRRSCAVGGTPPGSRTR